MDKLRWSGSAGGVLLGLVLALSGCVEAHDVDALGDPVFAGQGGGDGDGDGVPGDGDGDGDAPGDGDGDGDVNECNNCQASGTAAQFGVTVCCTDEGKCGLDVAALFGAGVPCLEQDAPGTLDDSCPAFSFMGVIELAGCCQADGTCGVMDTFVGLGCTMHPDGINQACGGGPD